MSRNKNGKRPDKPERGRKDLPAKNVMSTWMVKFYSMW